MQGDVLREAQSWPVGKPVPFERLDGDTAARLRELLADPAELARAVDELSWGRATELPAAARAVLSRVMLVPTADGGALVARRLVAERRGRLSP